VSHGSPFHCKNSFLLRGCAQRQLASAAFTKGERLRSKQRLDRDQDDNHNHDDDDDDVNVLLLHFW
jgi:hypothetical protein